MDSNLDEFDEQDTGRNPLRDRMKQLESENAELKARADEAAAAARELAFVKAGVDPNLPVAKYFMKGYEGELTAEAIREAALEAQIIRDTKADSIKQEASTWNRTNEIAAGSDAEPPVDILDRISRAKSPEEIEMLLSEARSQSNAL
jgi:hypothetical protein